MISFDEAYSMVMQHSLDLGLETVELLNSNGRILAEDILADRDFPPFHRATKDGIAVNYSGIGKGIKRLKIEGVASAGMVKQKLGDTSNALEIMTGAVVPENTDTVIMYEHLDIENGYATLRKKIIKGQNIHPKGSDVVSGTVLLNKNLLIGAAEMGVLAAVGKSEVEVRKLPKVCVISTGNELVKVSETPLPHQIRKSNTVSLFAALEKQQIIAERVHLKDDKEFISRELNHILKKYDVVLLSGGVSKGKFDFIPEVMQSLDVKKVFHRVAQRPGKPFWFGIQEAQKTVVFSFPGNPVSTFANYHIYFLPWLKVSFGRAPKDVEVLLEESIEVNPPLTRFIQVKLKNKEGVLWAAVVRENGSGDLTSLTHSDGFICLQPRATVYEKSEAVVFISTKRYD